MSRLVLIDGNAIMHRAYHALPKTLTNKTGEPTNAVYGFTAMLLRIIEDLNPTHIAICFDRKEPTFRKKLDKDYQAHRPKMDDELSSQFPKVKGLAEAVRIPVYDKVGYEADDIIGTISKKAEVDTVVIVTGDKDILQLVDDKIKVYMPVRGLSESELMDPVGIKNKLGVFPENIDDYKALVGDSSDNYKGVPGIGPKSAVKLIEKYKDIDGIYKNLDKLDLKTADKLRDGEKSARMSYTLAQIVTNVDLGFDLENMRKWQLDSKAVEREYEKLSFRTLARRTKKLAEKIQKENQVSLFS
jgi:DNA polymerase-1